MAKAFKCDGCGDYHDWHPSKFEFTLPRLGQPETFGSELCKECVAKVFIALEPFNDKLHDYLKDKLQYDDEED